MRNDRGAIIIHIAFALVGLLAFSAIVSDQGVLYVARRQAQSAADSAALAGAVNLMMDPSKTADATSAARVFAGQNAVWGQQPVPTDVIVSPLPFPCPASAGGGNACIRVDVLRGVSAGGPTAYAPDRDNAAHTNTMPTYMMGIVGLTTQGTRATATAQVAAGNAVECIKPWVVADKWTDNSATGSNTSGWDQDDFFNPGIDTYTPPSFTATGTPNDYGLELVLKAGTTGTLSSGWTMEIDLGGSGSADYKEEIVRCPNWVPIVGLYNPSIPCNVKADENPEKGCLGVKTGMSNGPTQSGVAIRVGLDSTAVWNSSTNTVQGGCMVSNSCLDADGNPVSISGRIVPLAIFNIDSYAASSCSGTNCVAKVVNLLGFFIGGMCNDVYPDPATRPTYCGTNSEAAKAVIGHLMAYPGQGSGASGSAGPATFLKMVRLVR